MPLYQAFIFDLNGTMIDDMRFHEEAWYRILINQLHTGLTREEVKGHMYGKNEEMLERIFGPNKFSKEEMDTIGLQKEIQYQKDFLSSLKLIKGLDTLLAKARANHILLAIGTAAIPLNVDYVLDNLHIRHYFRAIVTAHDIAVSKPNPDVFLKAAEQLGIAPNRCLVFEDSPKGIEAAGRAGMQAVGITSYHSKDELRAGNVVCIVDDYTDKLLDELIFL